MLADLASGIRGQLQRLEAAIGPLRYTFLGRRASSFFEQYTQFAEQMYGLADVVDSFSAQLIDAAKRLRSADRG
jgi:uncharacterized protein YukE